jgi:hypothetical protein
MGAEKRLNPPSPGVVPHRGRGDKPGTPFMLPLICWQPDKWLGPLQGFEITAAGRYIDASVK